GMLVLMAVWLPPMAIIPVHGLIQLGSNTGRAGLTWRHIDWRVMATFAPGVLVGAALGAWLLVELPEALWQLTISLFVLYLCWGPALPKKSFGQAGIFFASCVTSFLSLFVGATGPLVAAFIKQLHKDRFATVATFATAMVLQHAPKALIFSLAGFMFQEWAVFVIAMIACGFAGTWLGLRLLDRLSNRHFHALFRLALTLLAFWLLWQAIQSVQV
ncbi:MAG: sulfite exporter TauE/SafE family protein, partial [Oleiphilaceae bacterium]|nr:sulfite exporter TauE/SafE family protein [Oleiphilaceae bacterium]